MQQRDCGMHCASLGMVTVALRGSDRVSGSALTVRVNRCGWDRRNKMTRLQLEEEE